jgi:peroxiredoxin (alkyl hydroperoxide reductase subunit C)
MRMIHFIGGLIDREDLLNPGGRCRSLVQLGQKVADFCLPSSIASPSFHGWAQGSWTLLFGHVAAGSSQCTSEIALAARCASEIECLGVKVLGLSASANTEDVLYHSDFINFSLDLDVIFPLIVVRADTPKILLSVLPEETDSGCTTRRAVLIGPDLRVRQLFEYPAGVGLSASDIRRATSRPEAPIHFEVAPSSFWGHWWKRTEILRYPSSRCIRH